jgi:hypothetical protein
MQDVVWQLVIEYMEGEVTTRFAVGENQNI